jgi:hypothetical protein
MTGILPLETISQTDTISQYMKQLPITNMFQHFWWGFRLMISVENLFFSFPSVFKKKKKWSPPKI